MPHKLDLTVEHLMVINDCLLLGQYGRVAPVVAEINRQLQLESGSNEDNKSDSPEADLKG